MVEVDPIVLIGIGSTAMVCIIGILFFSMSKKDGKQEITEAAPTQKTSAKPSKKKKKSKSKTSKRADASSAASEGDFEVGKVGKTALAELEISEPEIVEEEIVSEPEAILAPVETTIRSKKSKENRKAWLLFSLQAFSLAGGLQKVI